MPKIGDDLGGEDSLCFVLPMSKWLNRPSWKGHGRHIQYVFQICVESNNGHGRQVQYVLPISEESDGSYGKQVSYFSEIRHRNLVTLLGYCQESGSQMLVFEYLPNGSMCNHLYGTTYFVAMILNDHAWNRCHVWLWLSCRYWNRFIN